LIDSSSDKFISLVYGFRVSVGPAPETLNPVLTDSDGPVFRLHRLSRLFL